MDNYSLNTKILAWLIKKNLLEKYKNQQLIDKQGFATDIKLTPKDKTKFMKTITIILLLISSYSFGQTDSVRVKIKKVFPYCLMESKKAKYYIDCPCDSLYKRGQIVWIKETDLLTTKN